jgi:hypothetical protein
LLTAVGLDHSPVASVGFEDVGQEGEVELSVLVQGAEPAPVPEANEILVGDPDLGARWSSVR